MQKRMFQAASLAALLSSPVLAPALGQAPGPAEVAQAAGSDQPVGLTAQGAPTPIVVLAVKGKVTWRPNADAPLKTAAVGDVLPEGAEVFTSVKAAIELQVGAGQKFTLDRLGKFIVREAIAAQGKEKTTVQVPYGRVQFQVSSATVANDVKIQAPDATLAVKGTTGGVEVSPGFPTLAFGGEFNRGVFDVDFGRGVVSTFRGNEQATANLPNPAEFSQETRFVDINDIWSHDGDEQFTIRDYQTVLFVLLEIAIREAVPEAPFDVFLIDEATQDLYRADIFGSGGFFGPLSGSSSAGRGVGTALFFPEGQAGLFGTLLRLESGAGSAQLLGVDLNASDLTFSPLASFSGFSGTLTGLGTLGDLLYAVQDRGSVNPDYISELTIDPLDNNMTAVVPRMNLGVQLEDSLAGVTPAGVLLVPGRLPTLGGRSNGAAGVLGANAVLFEIDPRNNYLSGAVSDISDSFEILPTTSIEPGLVINSVQRITGTSIVTDLQGTPILFVTTLATVNGVPNTTLVNLFTIGADGNSHLAAVARSTLQVEALAGESHGAVPASVVLAPAPSPSAIDSSLDPLFAALAYGPEAVQSGVLERLIVNQILATATDPSACASSSELTLNLATAIGAHVDQRSGAGAAIFDFRAGLPANHPCLAPSTGPGSNPLATGYAYIEENTGDIIARDLAGNEQVLRPGEGESKPVLGAALAGASGARSLLTLTAERALDGSLTPTLRSFDLQSPANAPQTLASFPRQELAGGVSRSFDLAGLGTIGSLIYTTGVERRSGEGGPQQGDPTVYEISGGTLVGRMAPGLQLQEGALAGAPARGTLFMLGQIPGSSGASGSFQLAGSGANAVLLEVDPRNNYLVSARSADQGDFSVQPGVPTAGVDPSTLTRVTGMTYLGNTLVMSAITNTGQQVVVQYNPTATNMPGDPNLRRVEAFPNGARLRELAGESTNSPPAPTQLSAPTGAIDTNSINRTFAAMAYSSQAAGSPVLRGLVAEHVAATSVNPAACRASAELNGPSLQGFLNQHVNQQSGVGQTVQQFRSSLPPNHPCLGRGG